MRRVLVVDDDRLVADTLRLVFRVNGFDAQVSYSAQDGLDMARSFRPELLLTDITMPVRNGLDLARDVQNELPECQVLMLTAYSSNLDRVHELSDQQTRNFSVVRKPVRPEELLQYADTLLKRIA